MEGTTISSRKLSTTIVANGSTMAALNIRGLSSVELNGKLSNKSLSLQRHTEHEMKR